MQTSVTQKLFDSKYYNQTWEVVKYESGTVIVTTKKKELAHFYVYGPKTDSEDSTDVLRYRYAEEFALFLNTGRRPSWLDYGTYKYSSTNRHLVWDDGTNLAARLFVQPPPFKEDEIEVHEAFTWLLTELAYSYTVDELSADEDKVIVEKMRLAAQEHAPGTPTQLRSEIDSPAVLGDQGTLQIVNSKGDVIAEASTVATIAKAKAKIMSNPTHQMKTSAQSRLDVHLSTPEDFLKAENHMLGTTLDKTSEDLQRMTAVLQAIREHSNLTSDHAQEMQMAAAWALEPKKWPKPKWLKDGKNA